MKLAFRWGTCALIASLLSSGLAVRGNAVPQMPQGSGAQAQGQATILGDLVKDWQRQEKTMALIADAMPEDKFGFKTTPPQRDYGQQVLHVALINVQLLKLVGGKATPPSFTAETAKSKAEVIKAMNDSYDYGLALLKEQTDASIVQTIPAPAFLGPSTRARIFWFLMSHSMDIYGQMVVYLRLNGVVPPASRKDMP